MYPEIRGACSHCPLLLVCTENAVICEIYRSISFDCTLQCIVKLKIKSVLMPHCTVHRQCFFKTHFLSHRSSVSLWVKGSRRITSCTLSRRTNHITPAAAYFPCFCFRRFSLYSVGVEVPLKKQRPSHYQTLPS